MSISPVSASRETSSALGQSPMSGLLRGLGQAGKTADYAQGAENTASAASTRQSLVPEDIVTLNGGSRSGAGNASSVMANNYAGASSGRSRYVIANLESFQTERNVFAGKMNGLVTMMEISTAEMSRYTAAFVIKAKLERQMRTHKNGEVTEQAEQHLEESRTRLEEAASNVSALEGQAITGATPAEITESATPEVQAAALAYAQAQAQAVAQTSAQAPQVNLTV